MDNNIDILLEEIHSDIPKINPNLSTKIYANAIDKEIKSNFPFFKKPLIIAFTSIIVVFIVLFGVISLGDSVKQTSDSQNDDLNNPNYDNENSIVEGNPYIPNLSPSTQSTVFIDYHYTIYTPSEDVVTVIINNKINSQKIFLKAYNLDIKNVKINNGDVEVKAVTIEDELFFEIVLDNTNTSIHYIDLSFKKGTISNILENNINFEMSFIMYIDEIDAEKGYGYDFKIDNVFDIREGNCI